MLNYTTSLLSQLYDLLFELAELLWVNWPPSTSCLDCQTLSKLSWIFFLMPNLLVLNCLILFSWNVCTPCYFELLDLVVWSTPCLSYLTLWIVRPCLYCLIYSMSELFDLVNCQALLSVLSDLFHVWVIWPCEVSDLVWSVIRTFFSKLVAFSDIVFNCPSLSFRTLSNYLTFYLTILSKCLTSLSKYLTLMSKYLTF